MISKKLFPKINEDLGKFGVTLLDLVTYGKSFRRIPVRANYIEEGKKANVLVIVNEIKEVQSHKGGAPLQIKFNSYIMDEKTHRKQILKRTNNLIKDSTNTILVDCSFILDYDVPMTIFDFALMNFFETLYIEKTKQEKIFNQRLKIKTLAQFYPRLTDEHYPELELELTCTVLNIITTDVKITCAFSLTEHKDSIVLLIDELVWKRRLKETIGSKVGGENEPLVIENTAEGFSSILVKSIRIEEFAAKQLMFFLKSLSDYLAKVTAINVHPVTTKIT